MLVVLGGGTLLAGQVEADLDAGVAQREYEAPSETPPLKLNEFELPSDVPLEIPRGAEISPDLSQLKLPNDLDIQLPSDLDLSDLDFELPQDFHLELPEGTVFSPPGLQLPNGATIRLPDGRAFEIPPGSNLDLPPEMIDRLLQQGIRPGALAGARDLDIRGLPPELMASLDPPQFEGGGRMRLPAGTTITLPDGRQFPFSPGAIPFAARYLLPEGSRIDLPFSDRTTSGAFPVPRPNSPSQLVEPGAPPSGATTMVTEITSLPSRVRKGEAFTVSGYVRDPTDRPVAGAPVDVFLNETKRAPGVLVGQGVSDASGTFVITLDLPDDKPARDYQLVNHAVAFTDRSGRVWGDGWGDPPISTYAATTLKLDLPARDGLGASTPIAGTLSDNTATPVSGASIVISVDGAMVGRATTTALGRFTYSHTFPSGIHTVEAQFLGTSNYDASLARGSITIDDLAIDVPASLRAAPGDTILLAGRVLSQGVAAPGHAVSIAYFGSGVNLVSDGTGRFSYAYALPVTLAPGLYQVQYALPDEGVAKLQTLELNLSARIALDAPGSADLDQGIPVTVKLVSHRGDPLAGQAMRLTLTGPGGTSDMRLTTDSTGMISTQIHPLRKSAGTYTLTARLASTAYIDVSAASTTVTLGLFEILWSVPSSVIRGEEAGGALTARFAGQPLADTTLTLDVFGLKEVVTDANGRAEWTDMVPADAFLGQTILSARLDGHPVRTTVTNVLAKPDLRLDAPDEFVPGKKVDVKVLLRDDRGEPLADQEVTLRILRADGGSSSIVRTNGRGEWSGALDMGVKRGENVTLSAQVAAGGPYLGGDQTQVMTATATNVAARDWILPATIGLAAVVGGGAIYAVRRLPRKARVVEAAPAPIVAAPALRPADLQLRFGIPEGEPAVWGIGEPLALLVRNQGVAGEVELDWGGGRRSVASNGPETRTTLTFEAEDDITVRARRAGVSDMAAAEASVRIVDYRKETAREFDLFLAKAQRLDASLTTRSTPREIGWTLEMRLGDTARPHLEEIALVMEITNYSSHDVGRAHYLRFVRASRALDPFFDATGGG